MVDLGIGAGVYLVGDGRYEVTGNGTRMCLSEDVWRKGLDDAPSKSMTDEASAKRNRKVGIAWLLRSAIPMSAGYSIPFKLKHVDLIQQEGR